MRLQDKFGSLSPLEVEVYQAVLRNPDAVQFMSVRQLAQEAHVSATTVLRFCQSLGCRGFSDFKQRLRDQRTETRVDLHRDSSEIIDCLQRMQAPSYEEQLDYVANRIVRAACVIFVGSGMSGVVAQYAARTMSCVGKLSFCIDDPQYPVNSGVFAGALVIAFSVSGESGDTIEHVSSLRQKRCTVVSVTSSKTCSLAKLADVNLCYFISLTRIGKYNLTTEIPAINIVERLGRLVAGLLENEREG